MTRVNGIFERDVALTMVLVANNKNIIFLDAGSDGFTNDDSDKLIDESQSKIGSIIGSANYDIGHTFSTGGGGLAQLNSPCTTNKARGITGSSKPLGDAYDIDYVAHEMGHQFGAHHTFNGDAGNCSGSNRNNSTAVEPGSGSTIMGYAGICSPQDVQKASDDYFHLVSIREMWNNISVGNSACGVQTITSNSTPVISPLQNYTIPISTPFVLSATATDSNGDNLTYTWEQLDTEIAVHPLVSTSTVGPAFRSIKPSASSKRYFPDVATVLAGNLQSTWEVLPSVSRTMRFGVNVRDNFSGGGQTASKENIVSFDASAGPFKVTSQNVAETWYSGTSQTVTWDVANTNYSPVSCDLVNILFSKDGGVTYPIELASNVLNNGSHIVVTPMEETTLGRIKIESVGNIFYAINSAKITIQKSEFVMSFQEYSKQSCIPNNVTYNFTYNTFLGFNEETTFTASGLPNGAIATFSPTKAQNDDTPVQLIISGLDEGDIGSFNILVNGTSATMAVTKTTSVTLIAFATDIAAPTLSLPVNNATNLLKQLELKWNSDINAKLYEVQIAKQNTFTTILETAIVTTNYYNPKLLQFGTNYFWRVKAINNCNESMYSTVFTFSTGAETCITKNSLEIPLNIPDNNISGVTSVLNIVENKTISGLKVNLNITHPWMGDLSLKLISPKGTEVLLAANLGDEGIGYLGTTFDDNASNSIITGIAPFTGIYLPQENLSKFFNEESYGEWLLKIIDEGPEDIGKITSWSLDVCGVNVISNDSDKDGIINSLDTCANTPLGSAIDAFGCVIPLPVNNYNITVLSETCPNKKNGLFSIVANQTSKHYIILNQTKYSFTNNLTINNLDSGIYSFCIIVEGGLYKNCYEVEIKAGLTAKASATVNSSKVEISMEQGTPPFNVFINDKEVLQTSSADFSVAIKHGDKVEVKTAIECEGVFSKTIELFENITAYPNPTTGNFEITLPISEKEIRIDLYNIYGQLLSNKVYPVIFGKVHVTIDNLPTGLYLAKVFVDKPITLKIVKN
jgi:subtilisin-like proprotein convertase family protein